jgi:ABC-2 type transport system permease protein
MWQLVRAEFLKMRTTRALFISVAVVLGGVLVSVAAAISGAGKNGVPALDTNAGERGVIATASSAALALFIIGILTVCGEFRHNTITATFLMTPRRGVVVAAKAIAVTCVGLILVVLADAFTLALAVPWLSAKGVHIGVFDYDVVIVLLGALVVTLFYGLAGVGFGALVRNQTAAVVAGLTWLLGLDSILVNFLPSVGKWTPSGAVAAVTSSFETNGHGLPMWGGALVLAAYAAVLIALGSRLIVRKDVA